MRLSKRSSRARLLLKNCLHVFLGTQVPEPILSPGVLLCRGGHCSLERTRDLSTSWAAGPWPPLQLHYSLALGRTQAGSCTLPLLWMPPKWNGSRADPELSWLLFHIPAPEETDAGPGCSQVWNHLKDRDVLCPCTRPHG